MELRNIHANCLKLKFSAKSKMPSDKEIFAFFRKRSWKPDMLNAMFREPREYCVYVKFQCEEVMKAELLKCPTTDTFNYDNGECTPVTFSTARGDFKYIRIIGLPIEVEDKNVASVLSKYGKIHQLLRERYGPDTGYPIMNGVRGAYMEIEEAIPSQLHIQRFQARIVYEGMQAKCFVCNSPDHMKQNCPKRASVNGRLKQDNGSYAGIVAGRSSGVGPNMSLGASSSDDQQATSSRTLAVEQLFINRESSKSATVQKATVQECTASEKVTVTTIEVPANSTAAETTGAMVGVTVDAMTGTTTVDSADSMDVAEEDVANRKRVHASTAAEEQLGESESSSTDPEAEKKSDAASKTGKEASLLYKQVKRLRPKNNKNKK